MKLIYITGPPGSGKSTIQEHLSKLGYSSFDIDDKQFGGPTNLKTNKPVSIPDATQRDPNWFNRHEWRINRRPVEDLKQKALDTDLTQYICGTASTDHLVWDLFDQVFYLSISQEDLIERIENRQSNDYGKSPEELQAILKRHQEMNKKMAKTKHVSIDTSQPLEDIVDQIVQQSTK